MTFSHTHTLLDTCKWNHWLIRQVSDIILTCFKLMLYYKLELENVAIANALQLEAARRRAVPLRFNSSPVPSLKSLSLSVAPMDRFYYSYVTLRCDLDLWPWTFVVCRLCHGQTVYEIWMKSNNPRRSYCCLNIWFYDLEHVSRVALCSWIVCTKFKLSQAVRSWNVTIFPCEYVTTRYDLDLWPVDLESLW